MVDDPRYKHVALTARARAAAAQAAKGFTDEWFPQQRAFYDDKSALVAAICGRRAGKTRGGSRHFVRLAQTIQGARLLYLNETRGEAERLAWYGIQNDGMAALVKRYNINAVLNASDLSIYFPDTDSWIWLRGAKDEHEVRKALGGAYHEVWWDEAQKIPSKLEGTIREVFMPALLDFGGRFRLTGTPSRNMAGIFYNATRPDDRRNAQWSSHHWTLLDNPHFGGEHEERWQRGVVALQHLYGGPEAAPIDSPIMQRELFGRWVREDAAYVYAVHKVPVSRLVYAPARIRPDGFPDVPHALRDLPFNWQEAQYALGIDIGWFPDPFAMTLWAWHGRNPRLYEVLSWKKNYLTSDEQNFAIKAVREHVSIGIIVADASNPAKPTVKGWSKEWVERYQQPILEAEKHHKHGAIDTMNNDILRLDANGDSRIGLRSGGPLFDELQHLQWSGALSGTGRLVEDSTLANDCADAALYAHRHSYSYRWRPPEEPVKYGTPQWVLQETAQLEQHTTHGRSTVDEEDDIYGAYH